MQTPRATFGGVPLANVVPVGWTRTLGAQAPMRLFAVHEKEWPRIRGMLGQKATLVVESDNAPTLRWERLFALREQAMQTPYHRAFIVSDVRWMWPRVAVVRSYNVPRKTGRRVLVRGKPIEVSVQYDRYCYAYASLNPDTGKKWTAKEVIEDVLGYVCSRCTQLWHVSGLPFAETPELTIENLELSEGGDTAVNRVLHLIPQAALTVDERGDAIVYDGTDLAATEDAMRRAGPQTQAGQIDRIVNLDAIRPSKIHVLFHREVELRFDTPTTAKQKDQDDTRTGPWGKGDAGTMDDLVNVLPLPDGETYLPEEGDPAPQGTWVPLTAALKAWNLEISDLTRAGKTPPELTTDNIRKLWFRLENVYTRFGEILHTGATANWPARVAAIRHHFRQTWQIPIPWMQRIRVLKGIRLGNIDPVSGARAPAQAWGQYCIQPTQKMYALAGLQHDPSLQFASLNVDAYPGVNGEVYDTTAVPATVDILDSDLGIFRVNYHSDLYGLRASIIPSMMAEPTDDKGSPVNRDLREQLVEVMALNGRVRSAPPAILREEFGLAVIVSAVPFAPNSNARCFKFTVQPQDIEPYLASRFTVSGGTGPEWWVVCPPSLMTAWYGWKETGAARESAKLLFGFNEPGHFVEFQDEYPGYELVNTMGQGDTDPSLLPAMARAIAAAQWASFVNAREGTRTVHLQPSVPMVGSIVSVEHVLEPDGRLLTRIAMPAARRPIDPLALIGWAERPWILGTVPGGHG